MAVTICGDHAIYIPHNTCNECETLAARVQSLENRLRGMGDIEVEITDANSNVTTAIVLGREA